MTTPDRRTMQAFLDRPLDELLEEIDLYTPTRKGLGSAWDSIAGPFPGVLRGRGVGHGAGAGRP